MEGEVLALALIIIFLLFMFLTLCGGSYLHYKNINEKVKSKRVPEETPKKYNDETLYLPCKLPEPSLRLSSQSNTQNDQDIIGLRIEYPDSKIFESLSRNTKNLGDECDNSEQCRDDLICSTPSIYRLESYNENLGSDLTGSVFVPFISEFLLEKGALDFVQYEDNMIAIMGDGQICIISDKGTSCITTTHKFTDLAIENGTIYALSESVVYRLNMGTYNTNNWVWKKVRDLPENILSIEMPHDQSKLLATAPDFCYIISNGLIEQQTRSTGFKIFGSSMDKYGLISGENSVVMKPSGKVINNISAFAINSKNKVYFVPSNENTLKRFSHMKTFMDEPVLVTNRTCQRSNRERIII